VPLALRCSRLSNARCFLGDAEVGPKSGKEGEKMAEGVELTWEAGKVGGSACKSG
jgi:hypothetical protein